MDELLAERQQAIRALATAVAGNRLPVEQFESRLALVRQAPNQASLEALVADLVPSGEYEPGQPADPGDPAEPVPVAPAEVLRVAAILSSSKRAGSWTVPYRLEIKVVLGDLTIDMRDAVFFHDILEIELDVLLGNLELIVPVGTQVENECEERLSSTTHSTRSVRGSQPIGLLIRIGGRVRFSNVEIKEKRPSWDKGPSIFQRLLGG